MRTERLGAADEREAGGAHFCDALVDQDLVVHGRADWLGCCTHANPYGGTQEAPGQCWCDERV